jgi:hypothetical protein
MISTSVAMLTKPVALHGPAAAPPRRACDCQTDPSSNHCYRVTQPGGRRRAPEPHSGRCMLSRVGEAAARVGRGSDLMKRRGGAALAGPARAATGAARFAADGGIAGACCSPRCGCAWGSARARNFRPRAQCPAARTMPGRARLAARRPQRQLALDLRSARDLLRSARDSLRVRDVPLNLLLARHRVSSFRGARRRFRLVGMTALVATGQQ